MDSRAVAPNELTIFESNQVCSNQQQSLIPIEASNRSSTPLPDCGSKVPFISCSEENKLESSVQIISPAKLTSSAQDDLNEKKLSFQDVQEILETDLSCAICQDIYINPLILNCSHSFCKFCLYRWLSKKQGCPQCRMIVSFQAENLALRNIVNKMVQKSGPQFQLARTQCVSQRLKDEEAQEKSGVTRKFLKRNLHAQGGIRINRRSHQGNRGRPAGWSNDLLLSIFTLEDFAEADDDMSGGPPNEFTDSDSDQEDDEHVGVGGEGDEEDIEIDVSSNHDDDSRDVTFDIDQVSVAYSDTEDEVQELDDDDIMDDERYLRHGSSSSSSSSSADSDVQVDEIFNDVSDGENEGDDDDDDDDDDVADDEFDEEESDDDLRVIRENSGYNSEDFAGEDDDDDDDEPVTISDSSSDSDSSDSGSVASIDSERNHRLESDDEDDSIQPRSSGSRRGAANRYNQRHFRLDGPDYPMDESESECSQEYDIPPRPWTDEEWSEQGVADSTDDGPHGGFTTDEDMW